MRAVEQRAVATDEADIRLDRWFKRHFPDLGHGRLQKLLRTGQVRVDGKRAQANARLATGQIVRIPPLGTAESADLKSSPARRDEKDADELRRIILHEDDALIALDKPAGLAVQGGSKTRRHIDGMLASLAPKGERYRLVHRLDRDTSGLLVVAKTPSAAAKLSKAFQRHDVKKLYWALVAGLPPLEHGIIDKPLAKAASGGRPDFELVQADIDGAQDAKTRYRTIARAGKLFAWLALQPLSGRTHQLRVHCASMDCPILGDPKYGGEKTRPAGAPGALMLHARELALPHPDGGRLTLEAPLPDTMRAGFAWIGFEPDPNLPGARLLDFEEL
ncbi:MAG: RluA family pseudouridine synthase [Alphaproteobacteria bacterium]